ncbi:MAG TPA: LysR family transcriptional regulator [Jiangellaceae bacterium]
MDLLRHLRFFVAVAEERHYGHAATQLQMTQPPLSQGIRRLEEHLGVRLFDRDARSVRLTDSGRLLLPLAEDLLASAARLRQTATTMTARRVTRIGLPPELGAVAAAVTVRLHDALADVDLDTVVAPTETLLEQVRSAGIDIAITRHPAVVDGLEAGDVARVPTWLLLPAGHAHDSRESVPISTAADLSFALSPRRHHPAAHDLIVDTLRRHGHTGTTMPVEPAGIAVTVATGRAAGLSVDPPPPAAGIVGHRIEGNLLPFRFRVVTAKQSSARPRAPLRAWASEANVALVAACEER